MTKRTTLSILALSLFTAIMAFISHAYLDTRLALLVDACIVRRLSHGRSTIPDLLLIMVFLLVCTGWATRFFLKGRDTHPRLAVFARFIGFSVPLAYIAKDPLKWLFGRINTRAWFLHHGSTEFHWFQGGGEFSGFPSGHMAVFTALAAAVCHVCPRSRPWSVCFLLALAVALIITEYHFLSDILAGALLGFVAHVAVVRAGQVEPAS